MIIFLSINLNELGAQKSHLDNTFKYSNPEYLYPQGNTLLLSLILGNTCLSSTIL